MANSIDELIQEVRRTKHLSYREIAQRCGIPEQTLHSARRRESIDNLSIDTFLHIAHGLGLTADELYYFDKGLTAGGKQYTEPRQKEINSIYESVSEDGKQQMWVHAIMVRNTFSEDCGCDTVQEAR